MRHGNMTDHHLIRMSKFLCYRRDPNYVPICITDVFYNEMQYVFPLTKSYKIIRT